MRLASGRGDGGLEGQGGGGGWGGFTSCSSSFSALSSSWASCRAASRVCTQSDPSFLKVRSLCTPNSCFSEGGVGRGVSWGWMKEGVGQDEMLLRKGGWQGGGWDWMQGGVGQRAWGAG